VIGAEVAQGLPSSQVIISSSHHRIVSSSHHLVVSPSHHLVISPSHHLINSSSHRLSIASSHHHLPSIQVSYSFLRGAAKQYGTLLIGNPSTCGRFGDKCYNGTAAQNGGDHWRGRRAPAGRSTLFRDKV
jgi:hypothetical protein